MYEIEGEVIEVGETKTFNGGFTKRELILDCKEPKQKYSNPLKFTFKKDKCDLLDEVKKGQRIKVCFSPDGRRWDGPKGTQYFMDLTGFSIDGNEVSADMSNAIENADEGISDDMPF